MCACRSFANTVFGPTNTSSAIVTFYQTSELFLIVTRSPTPAALSTNA